ncbi:MAG: MBL fold metallo-hydrolase [Planctomycetota bacterium]
MANLFSLEVLDAKHGDALLLHYGTTADPQSILIDGGPTGVWSRSLGKVLDRLRGERGDPLRLRRAILSHIDDDHIHGLLDLTDKMEKRQDDGRPPQFEIDGIWFNTFDDLVGNTEVAAFRDPDAMLDIDDRTREAAAVIASVGQGRALRDRAQRLGLQINDGNPLLTAGIHLEPGNGLVIDVLGPSAQRIQEFQAAWDAEVKKNGWDQNVAAAEVAEFVDKSPWNLSSTILLARFGTKTMLLTGDARGDDIIAGLRSQGILTGQSVSFDILKIPHHGSDRNVSTTFFRTVRARHYVISANGEYGNPDIPTLQMILEARGNAKYTVHCTYRNGIKGHKQKLDQFLAGLTKTQRDRFAFREESALSLRIDL